MNAPNTANPPQPTLSVVVPTYNRAEYLRATIDSVLEQDYPHVECIVIDAASTDATIDILKSYGQRIRWVSEPDDGHADAINKGWRMATGEILAWLNADDIYATPQTATTIAKFFHDHPDTDVVYGDCRTIDTQGRPIGWTYVRNWDLRYAVEYSDHCIPQPASFIRKRVIDRVGELDTQIFTKDREFWFRVGLACKIQYLPVTLACERDVPGISQDGRRVAPAVVQVTKKLYVQPNLPVSLLTIKRRAISNAYLRGLDYAYHGGPLWGVIFAYAARALAADPTNLARVARVLDQTVNAGLATGKLPPLARAAWTPIRLTCQTGAWFINRLKQTLSRSANHDASAPGADAITRDWVLSRLAHSHGRALIYESQESDLPLVTAMRGYDVLATAPQHTPWPYSHTRLRFSRDGIDKLNHPPQHFDLVINRSTHNTLTNKTLDRCCAWVKPGGILLLTFVSTRPSADQPITHTPDGFDVAERITWVQDNRSRWVEYETDYLHRPPSVRHNETHNPATIRCLVLKKHAASFVVPTPTEAAA